MLELLIGNIASGKSTYAKKRAAEGAIIINDDAIVQCLHAGYYHAYRKKLKVVYKAVEMQVAIIALSLGCDVIVDRPNMTVASRRRFIGLASSMDIPCIAVKFPLASASTHALRRINSDPRGYDYDYWLRVAESKAAAYEAPTLAEGFSRIASWNPTPLQETF